MTRSAGRRRVSVRLRLALLAAGIVLVGCVVFAFTLLGTLTEYVADVVEPAPIPASPTRTSLPLAPETAARDARGQLTDDARRFTLWSAPLAAAFVGVCAWVTAGSALRPVAAIERRFRRLASGDLTHRVPVPGGSDEVARLARTMNETLGVLETAATRQRRFIADAAHELRSPIGVLRNRLEIAATYPDAVDPRQTLTAALRDVDRLQTVAEDLLTLARLEAGEPPPAGPVDLAALAHAVIAPERAEYRVVAEAATVRGSARQLARLLQNLVDNAGRHASTRVRVTVRSDGSDVVIDVDDDGPGIAAEHREQVFAAFFRVDDGRARSGGGTGLGLAIAREIVRAHGGTIEVRDAPAGGARLHAELPAATDDPDPRS